MIEKMTKSLVERMIRTGIIEKERAPLYAFGMEQGLRTLLEMVLMLVTGIVFGLFWQGAVMMTVFCLIRVYAGGYHAKTPMQCAVKSWLMFTAFLLCCVSGRPFCLSSWALSPPPAFAFCSYVPCRMNINRCRTMRYRNTGNVLY